MDIYNQVAKEGYEMEMDSIKIDINHLIDHIEDQRSYITLLEGQNKKKTFEIQTFRDNNLNNQIVENKMTEMGNVFFNQVSLIMRNYAGTVSL